MMSMLRATVLCSFVAASAQAQPYDISDYVAEIGMENATTAVVVKRLSDGHVWSSNFARAEERFQPASTSKIPHTLIALESGFATPETTFEWDGKERFMDSWNQDQSLVSAYQRSAVWVYQHITTSLGQDKMSEWLQAFDYGNADIGDEASLDNYWLRGPLAISAEEQIDFLARLAQDDLPLAPATYADARKIMMEAEAGGARLYAKTGYYLRRGQEDLGWYVGWIETGEETYVFALNMDLSGFDQAPQRKVLARHVLARLDIFPAP